MAGSRIQPTPAHLATAASRSQPMLPGNATVAHPEFLPPPGCIPAYKIGPGGQTAQAGLERFTESAAALRGPEALGKAELFMTSDGELDYVLYNYLFMCSLNKELAVQGLQARMQQITCPPRCTASVTIKATDDASLAM